MFLGPSSLSLDAKGRLSIPAKYQAALINEAGGQLWVTKHPHGCLMILPKPEWDVFYAIVAGLPMSDLWLKRIFLSNALSVELDATGRILIAPELRESSGITKETTLRGMGKYFELWDKATYDANELRQINGMQDVLPEAMKAISF
ncbi:MAG TPA: division/cell wall cluster transcriptional repressor MraZ [Burkholderiaceae bacterium]|nr:division/cell wall cluster transcriptional repressor MraZ [Polaromonas sp.]HOZ66317.1 division/cell wall cluster transcriptional repressor MraZ [Burkholderiaceae bacterium]